MTNRRHYPKDIVELDIHNDIDACQKMADRDVMIMIDKYRWRIQQLGKEEVKLFDVESELQKGVSAEKLAQRYTDRSETNGDIENVYDYNVDASNLHDYLKVIESNDLLSVEDIVKKINGLINVCTYKQECLHDGIEYFIDHLH